MPAFWLHPKRSPEGRLSSMSAEMGSEPVGPAARLRIVKIAESPESRMFMWKYQCRMDNLSVTAIYPGSFDPPTRGHLDLIRRSSGLFDRLVVAILRNDAKQPLFSMDERVEMMTECTSGVENVEIDRFEGLLVDYAAKRNARVLIRGIRAVSDYEYELQMTSMNRRLRPNIETVFLMANEQYSFISSRLVKEVFRLGADVSGLVPPNVESRLKLKMKQELSQA
jgi:pantetheine-phosphate adenylyltransferase